MDNTIIQIEEGKLQGKHVVGWKNTRYYSFQGIPYAKPPLGELRFKAPTPAENWTGIKDCTKEGSECYSRHLFNQNLIGSEDCLNLNVYTKELPTQSNAKPKPVMVWIHGGGFLSGSNKTDLHGPDYLVNEDVVLVTINYRLGLLGFLSLEDQTLGVPGNAGLKDQLLALKWVQRNIKCFGGDPGNVTIFGVSAGAASVHFLILSPMAKGLFHKAIMQSGSALCPWSIARSPSEILVGQTGCNNEKHLLEKLQALPVEKLHELQEKTAIEFKACNAREVGLIIEQSTKFEPHFITEHPLEIIKNGTYNKVPMIVGYCSMEGLFFAAQEKRRKKSQLITDFEEAIPNNFHIQRRTDKSKNIARAIKEFYYGNEEPSEDNKEKLFLLLTDAFFFYGTYEAMKLHALSSSQPVYFYRFSAETKLNIYKKAIGSNFSGTSHADDIGYLFKTYLTPKDIEENSAEYLAIKRTTKMWTEFARTGNPNPVQKNPIIDVNWEPVQERMIHFIDIGRNLSVGLNPEEERMQFWDYIQNN